ncbi:MAG: T9SS type A sorting domain-containing protein, partial [Bacteroidales bacterium]|nr:T9SS type A sorting domain-containing protein [Bacteroidales bacterium]
DTSAVATAAYTIHSVLTPEGDLVFAENFNKLTKASTTVISNVDEVTDMPGWWGANMYPEVGEIKGGTSSKAGKLVSPEIDLHYNNGKYYVAFFARAFNNRADSTKIRLIAGDETVLVSDLDKTGMFEYVYEFNNGTANTQLTFEALAADYNRFYLDSIRVYQVLPERPMIIVPSSFEMTTVEGTPASLTVTVRGKLLTEDVRVSCPMGNFTVSPAILNKEDVLSESGAEIIVTFNGAVPSDEEVITLTSGKIMSSIEVTAVAEAKPAGEITVVSELTMNTVKGTPVSEKVTVKGKFLENDVTVSCSSDNFSVSPATLSKEAVMSEAGAEFTVTFNGEVEADKVDITLVCGDLTKTIAVTATANGGVTPECDAPTLLSAAVTGKNVVLTWNGETETFRILVYKGVDTVCNTWCADPIYELENLAAGVYNWAVASICKGGLAWATGDSFEVKSVANESAEGLAFRIYPNPTAGVFYVEVAEGARMEIFTVGGVMIRNAELKAGKNELRLENSGIYFVRLTNAHGEAVKRVVVR